ncbi:hypothetical protein Droror1_Dr00017365 [Drosera rotundifolia]
MECGLRWSVLLVLPILVLASLVENASSTEYDFQVCEVTVKKWASSSMDEVKEDKHRLQDLLFFLHVPRTGGRSYYHCFLKKFYSSMLECPRSYDKLRFDPGKPNCRLLVTHDDYSVVSKLPKENTSVVTIMRNPIDRVFSTYEFSIEVAARFLVHPNLTSATTLSKRLRKKTGAISTLDIWPWKYLVPWMRQDLFARREARMKKAQRHYHVNNSYNMEHMAMPLQKYIYDPIALDIVHNGATFQVAGLTNNSYLAESHQVRHCVRKYQDLGKHVLEVAKRRLDNMLYVGLTEDHKESASLFGQVVGKQVMSQLEASNSTNEDLANERSEQGPSLTDPELESDHSPSGTDVNSSNMTSPEVDESTLKNMATIGEVMEAYKVCITGLRKAESNRRYRSLAKIAPANFTKEARRKVSESVLRQIEQLNSLDIELYEYAKDIFARQHKLVMHEFSEERLASIIIDSSRLPSWTSVALAVVTFVLLLLLYFSVKVRRRTLKVKL